MQIIPTAMIIASLVMFVPVLDHVHAEDQEHGIEVIPAWIAESAAGWIDGDITDSEFMSDLSTWLTGQGTTAATHESRRVLAEASAAPATTPGAETAAPTTKPVHVWMEDRTRWWVEGRITDEQFLGAALYLNNSGFLENSGMRGLDWAGAAQSPKNATLLEDFLPTESEIDLITKVTKWRFVTVEHGFDKTEGAADSVRILMRDINRVYDPVFNKYKIPTISMQITQLSEQISTDAYWSEYANRTSDEVLDSAHMTGRLLDDTVCFFNHSDDGAITACIHGDMIIQVVIFDAYSEHYFYGGNNIDIDETEPTTRIMDEIIRKINAMTGRDAHLTDKLRHALQNNSHADSTYVGVPTIGGLDVSGTTALSNLTGSDMLPDAKNATDVPRQEANVLGRNQNVMDPEKLVTEGVDELACIRDDFGILTVTGRYVNGGTPSNQTDIEIVFTDWQQNVMGRTSISFVGVFEFETREFLGHAKWDGSFAECHALVSAR